MRDDEAQLIHDMRNTALVLQCAAQQLRADQDAPVPGMRESLTAMMLRRSEMLVRLLGDLATSHQAERGDLALSLGRVDLAELCLDVLAHARAAGGARVRFSAGTDVVALGDPLRVTQVLDNLLSNAVRYGGDGVEVTVRRVGQRVHLEVADDGPGVPPALVDRLFDAYSHGTTSASLGGTGLGLLIARQLSMAMGGTLNYAYRDGAVFTVVLPGLPVTAQEISAPDVADQGHSVALWDGPRTLARHLVPYVAHGLLRGEAVVVAATSDHHALLVDGLAGLGLDPAAALTSGQLVALDAGRLHRELAPAGRVDPDLFARLVAAPVTALAQRWQGLRVFGEIVDLYARRGDEHLALELEGQWNDLRRSVSFPLLCAYELTPAVALAPEQWCACHDAVLAA